MTMLSDGMLMAAGDAVSGPAYVGSTQAWAASLSGGISVPAPSVAAGDLLIAVAWRIASGGMWSSTGWTKEAEVTGTHGVAIFKKTATGSEPSSYTFTHNTGTSSGFVFIIAYRGASTIAGNNLAGMSLNTVDPQVAASMSVTQGNALLAICGLNNNTVTLTSGPAGMTSRQQQFSNNSPRGALYDLINPSTGASGTKTFDISAPFFGGAFLVEVG